MRKDIQSSTKLFFSNELLLRKIYSMWAFIAIVLFGFFGAGRLIGSFIQKVNLYKEMVSVNYDLNVKLQQLSVLSESMDASQRFLPLLEDTIPADLNTHSYMVMFMQQAAFSGFSVKNFVPSSESQGGDVPIIAVLEGNGDIKELIRGLESLQRVTVVDSVKYVTRSDMNEVTLSLRIFNL